MDIEGAAHPVKSKNISLDVVDCIAKNLLYELGASPLILDYYNKFARNNQINSKYTFLGKEIINFLDAKLESSQREFCSANPEFQGLMLEQDSLKERKLLDGEEESLAWQRVQEFCSKRPRLRSGMEA